MSRKSNVASAHVQALMVMAIAVLIMKSCVCADVTGENQPPLNKFKFQAMTIIVSFCFVFYCEIFSLRLSSFFTPG